MKLQNMKLAQKWREYAGPKDERLETENAKIYKLGFMLLSFGMLTLLVYQIMAQQVTWVHDGAGEAFRRFRHGLLRVREDHRTQRRLEVAPAH